MTTWTEVSMDALLKTNGPRTTVRILPFDKERSCSLGGGGLDRVATMEHYKRLPRMSTLPFPPQTGKIEHEEAKNAYIKMCGGDFAATYSIGGGPDYNGETLTLEAGLNGGKAMMELHLFGTPTMFWQFQPRVYEESVLGSLSSKAEDALGFYVLHNFVRTVGAQLPWKVILMAHVSLLGRYSEKNLELAYDTCIMTTDIAINNTSVNAADVANAACYMSTACRAMGHHVEAALAIQEIANGFVENNAESYAACLKESAYILRRSREYQLSQQVLLKALAMAKNNQGFLNVKEPITSGHFEYLIETLISWCRYDQHNQEVQDLLAVLNALLFVVGYQPEEYHSPFLSRSNAKMLLQPKFQKTKHAFRFLSLALKDSTIETFNKVILGCKHPAVLARLQLPPSTHDDDDDAELRQEAMEALGNAGGGTSVGVLCGNPSCGTRLNRCDMKRCPCKQVYYCQKKCQVRHWKEHKATCTCRASKRK